MNLSALTLLDIGILSIILLSTIFAMIRGLLGSVLSLVGWVVSTYVTYWLYPFLEPLLAEKISNPLLVAIIGYSALMIFFLILFALINGLLSSSKLLGSRFLDCMLGGVFGIFRGFLLVSFCYLCMSVAVSLIHGTSPKDANKITPEWLKDSKTYTFLQFGKELLLSFMSKDVNHRLELFYQGVSKKNKNDRFIAYTTDIMLRSIPKEERKKIEENSLKESLTKSDAEVEISTLQSLLKAYQAYNKTNLNAGLNKEDIDRLQLIIHSFNQNNGVDSGH